MEIFYTVLECTETSSLEELKKNYQRLIKQYHPDKGTCYNSDMFLKIDLAYKTLKNERTRKDYDASLVASQCSDNVLIYAELSKADIELDNKGNFYYPCRCGDQFIIQKIHLNEAECVIECCECSNCILIR